LHQIRVIATKLHGIIIYVLMTQSLAIVSCRAPDPVQQCPAGYIQNDGRASRLWERLGTASSGAALMARGASKPPICFGQTDISTITTTGVVYFDDKLDESEGAARLGHLFLHFVNGLPSLYIWGFGSPSAPFAPNPSGIDLISTCYQKREEHNTRVEADLQVSSQDLKRP
jgi:hypothetical protein